MLYADDTTIYLSGHNLKSIFETFNHELQYFYLWTKVNRITINFKKTKFMIVSTKKSNNINMTINIGGTRIERVKYFKFLDIYIDEVLNFKTHIDEIHTKLSRCQGILRRLNY